MCACAFLANVNCSARGIGLVLGGDTAIGWLSSTRGRQSVGGTLVAAGNAMIFSMRSTPRAPRPLDARHRKHTHRRAVALRNAAALTRLVSGSLRRHSADLLDRLRVRGMSSGRRDV
jgi:hypothetical protein